MKPCIRLTLLLATLSLATTATAQDGYVVWSGGIGADERETAPQEGTKLVFFAEGGKFVAQVKVQVKDADGKVLVDTTCPGPWLILKLPAGRYQVQAQMPSAAAQGGNIEVLDGKNQEFSFRFTLGE